MEESCLIPFGKNQASIGVAGLIRLRVWLHFFMGYRFGYGAVRQDGPIPFDELVPPDFHRFVTERYGRTYPDGGKGWQTFIEENTASEQEAFELFFKLREEFEVRSK